MLEEDTGLNQGITGKKRKLVDSEETDDSASKRRCTEPEDSGVEMESDGEVKVSQL